MSVWEEREWGIASKMVIYELKDFWKRRQEGDLPDFALVMH